MKLPPPVLLAAVFFCAGLSADQALFRNSGIGFGGGWVLDMKAADVNHDGKQDVILFQAKTASQSTCSVVTMFGNGDGTFRTPVKTPITSCGSVAFGDLDSDGNVDVVLSGSERVIEVYRGNSDGSFTLRSTKNKAGSMLYGGANLLLSDLNGDGKLDLIIPVTCCKLTETFRGNGDGTFADAVLQPDFVTGLSDIVAADFNGDGRTDML
ncbi:MAG: VCBS repeat-containing protein, partial [Thermoanaerobaculia bacterium]